MITQWQNKSYTENIYENIPKINHNQGVDHIKYTNISL